MRHRWIVTLLFALIVMQAHSQNLHRQSTANRAAPPRKMTKAPLKQPAFDTSAINDPNQPMIDEGASGPGVVRAQILLARAHFSCGEIDGHYGKNLSETARAYQKEHGLTDTGAIDDDTWKSLNSDKASPLTTSTIQEGDVKGPFVTIPSDIMQQAKLPELGYTSVIEELAERFHISPELLRQLNPHTDFNKAGEQLTVPNVLHTPPGWAAQVIVSKSDGAVRALDESEKLLAFYVATIGSEHDPLPIGDYIVTFVRWKPKFHYDAQLFWDAKDVNDRATIQPGPNNPVGIVWINLSKEHYGIHGTPDPGRIGHAYSHGCIRLTNWDAAELAAMVKPETPVSLRE
jgi:lipoprotein-anchoring transpeptidase ErfK/SrfK